MRNTSPIIKEIPLDIVGSSTFGRYPKISIEETFNMFQSDGWLVPYPGYKNVLSFFGTGQGRGIYASNRANLLFTVVDNIVYSVTAGLSFSEIGSLQTYTGDVFIAENDGSQIAFCDKKNIYIYNYKTGVFSLVSLPFIPGYISFMDGYFIAAVSGQAQWQLSAANDGTTWPASPSTIGTFQTKPDTVQAAIRVPGKGNLLFVFGNTIVEPWYDVGYTLFPFQRSSYFNIDYGCVNPATIATNDTLVVWLGSNERSGPVIMYSDGGEPQKISTDGINYVLDNLKFPQISYGFLFQQDGHIFYQIAFPSDNVSYAYDFTDKKFYTVTDEFQNCHIAKKVAFFNNAYYFISFIDGALYQMSGQYTDYNGAVIPRIRVCKNIRMKDASFFITQKLTFTVETGQASDIPRIDLSISRDGGVTFGSSIKQNLYPLGERINRYEINSLGAANDMVPQFRFWTDSRFIATDGSVSVYQ